jgi:hypothetical protein
MPPVQRWRAILGPGPLEGKSVWNTPSYEQNGERISPESAVEVEAWAYHLELLHDPRLDIAAKRLASARAKRNEWADELIDAVIAWENICSGKTETTFRVTASLAKLIEQQPGIERETLLASLGTVYGVRSAVVHGGEPDQKEIKSAAKKAVAVARLALRALYLDRENLIPMTSGERANRLLLHEP